MLFNEKGFDEHVEIMETDVKECFKVGIRREKNRKRKAIKKHWTVFTASVLLICGITTVGCYVSPKFAFALKDIPILKLFYDMSREEEIVMEAKEHGYGDTLVNVEENDEFKFEIDYGMKDRKSLVLSCIIEDKIGDNDINLMYLRNVKLVKENGDKIHIDYLNFKNSEIFGRTAKGTIKIGYNNMDYYEAVSGYKFSKFNTNHGGYGGVNFNEMEGNLILQGELCQSRGFDFENNEEKFDKLMDIENLEIELSKLKRCENEKIEVDKEIILGGEKVTFEYVDVQPSELEIYVKGPIDEELEKRIVAKDIRFNIEDEYGNKYDQLLRYGQDDRAMVYKSSWTIDGITIHNTSHWDSTKKFKSPYYNDAKQILIKDLEVDTWIQENIIIDYKENKVTSTTENAIVTGWNFNMDKLEIEVLFRKSCDIESGNDLTLHYKRVGLPEQEYLISETTEIGETDEGVKKRITIDLSKIRSKDILEEIHIELKDYALELSEKYEGEIRIDLE